MQKVVGDDYRYAHGLVDRARRVEVHNATCFADRCEADGTPLVVECERINAGS